MNLALPSPILTLRLAGGDRLLPLTPGVSLLDMLVNAGFAVPSGCGGGGKCGLCRVRVLEGEAMPAGPEEQARLSAAEREEGLRLSCRCHPLSPLTVALDAAAADPCWRLLAAAELPPVAVLPIEGGGKGLGLAIDIGTTQLRLSLWDLAAGRRLCAVTGGNPQSAYGADILTRLMMAGRSPETAARLQELVVDAVAGGVEHLAGAAGVAPGEIVSVQAVGNTAMLSLLSGRNSLSLLEPDNWTRRVECAPAAPAALAASWRLAPEARISLVPALGGFVGSDLLAGILTTGLDRGPGGSLLIDFGTNSEMALWDGETLFAAAAAGGPAFEGCGISCGMPGEKGAIYRVRSGPGEALSGEVLGGGEALGICGSGLVDVMACLRRSGGLDRVGRLRGPVRDGVALGEAVFLSAGDIDVFQRAKAAIGAGIEWLCARAGMNPAELRRVVACGAFGRVLDPENAGEIGLLPRLAPGVALELEGNAALGGAERLLFSAPDMPELAALLAHTRLFNLGEDPEFEILFIENLYIQPIRERASRADAALEDNHLG